MRAVEPPLRTFSATYGHAQSQLGDAVGLRGSLTHPLSQAEIGTLSQSVSQRGIETGRSNSACSTRQNSFDTFNANPSATLMKRMRTQWSPHLRAKRSPIPGIQLGCVVRPQSAPRCLDWLSAKFNHNNMPTAGAVRNQHDSLLKACYKSVKIQTYPPPHIDPCDKWVSVSFVSITSGFRSLPV